MMHSFPNTRFGLIVGIARGAPGKHEGRIEWPQRVGRWCSIVLYP
jgi:hypothetical protein